MHTRSNYRGFTIVELLIVIVVIGILAAIVIVAFNGVQGRASDSAVQSDLKQIASKFQQTQAIDGVYPTQTQLENGSLDVKINKANYPTSTLVNGRNLGICMVRSPGVEKFAVFAYSKSGKWFSYSTAFGLRQETGAWTGSHGTTCPTFNISTSETGLWITWGAQSDQTGGWFSWVEG